jgi:predicted Fe-Mo cluster-binding NifX family protein
MKIAITSNNGKDIDSHFGKAERVVVYEVSDDHAQLVEIRNIVSYSESSSNHSFNETKFNTVYETIADCKMLYTQKIGETPANKLIDKGIIPKMVQGRIENIPLLLDKKII